MEKIFRFIVLLSCFFFCSCDSSQEETVRVVVDKPQIPTELVDTDVLSGENALFHAGEIVSFGDRATGTKGYQQQLSYLANQLRQLGWKTEEQRFSSDTPIGKVDFVNLRARFGQSPVFTTPAKIIVSCHIDTKTGIPGFVGANDGASGAALILELARVLSKTPDKVQLIELVFFDGEESFERNMTERDGLYGSKYYVSALGFSFPSYVINLDMVGRQGMKIRIPPDTDSGLYRIYRNALSDLNLPSSRWGVASGSIIDDHMPFVMVGVPAINIIDDFNDGKWWHTPKDDMSILSAKSFAESGRVVLYIINKLLDQ